MYRIKYGLITTHKNIMILKIIDVHVQEQLAISITQSNA